MNEEKYERRCNNCDTVNARDRTECYQCGHKSFARYRVIGEETQTLSGPVAERREF